MGDEAARDHLAVPLTEAARARIVAKLGELPESVRGREPAKLVEMVETALTVDDGDLVAPLENTDFGPYTPASDRALDQLSAALVAAIPAARIISALLAPVDASQLGHWREQHPWVDELDHIAPALMRFGIPADDASVAMAQRTLQEAMTAVTTLFASAAIDLQGSSNNKDPRAIRWLVRACACYRADQGLKNTCDWSRPSNGNPEVQPLTDYSQLLAAVGLAFGFSGCNSSLRYEGNIYNSLLKQLKRPPTRSDFDNPFRTLVR